MPATSPRRHTLADLLRRTRRRYPARTAIRCGAVAWTYAEFDDICSRLAAVRRLSEDINAVQADPSLARRFVEEMYVNPSATTPEQFAQIVDRDLQTWTSVIRRVGVALD